MDRTKGERQRDKERDRGTPSQPVTATAFIMNRAWTLWNPWECRHLGALRGQSTSTPSGRLRTGLHCAKGGTQELAALSNQRY